MLTAMLAAVEALVLELVQVRVNAVTLGLMDTPLLHTAYGVDHERSSTIGPPCCRGIVWARWGR
jgi:hypothetical protein